MIPDASPEDRANLAVVPFGFWTDHEPQPDGTLKAVDHAKWGKRGYANWESSDKVSRLMKSAKDNRGRDDATLTVWDALEPHYKRWKEGQDAVTDGYALEGWAGGITKGQITACKALHIHSVEDLANSPDDVAQKLGMGAIKLRDTARAFVATLKSGTPQLAAENAELKARIEQMAKEQEEDRKAMKEFMASHSLQTPDMPEDTVEERRGPGRPRKAA